MKYITILIAMLFLISIRTHAQHIEEQHISLAQAFETGIKNRYDAQANSINVDLANNTVQRNKKEWLPDITASGTIRYNTQLQKMIIQDGQGGNNTLTMGAKNQTTFALDLTQNIYKPGLTTDIKIARNDVLLQEEKNKEKEISIKQSIAEAYLNVLLKKIQWDLSNATTERNLKYYTIAEDKYRLNTLLENELLKSKLDYENAKINALEAAQNYDLAMMQLKYQLNIDNTTKLVLTDSIESFQQEYVLSSSDVSNTKRTELQQLYLQYESNKLKLDKSNQYFLPTISIIANYSAQYQRENFDFTQRLWTPFNYVGLKLNMPITGNFKNTNTQIEYRLKMNQIKLQEAQKQHDITYEIRKYKTELLNAEGNVRASQNNLNLSKKLHENQINMYQLGTATYGSILDAENSMTTSEQNYIKAVYNYLVAKINYDKSIGIL